LRIQTLSRTLDGQSIHVRVRAPGLCFACAVLPPSSNAAASYVEADPPESKKEFLFHHLFQLVDAARSPLKLTTGAVLVSPPQHVHAVAHARDGGFDRAARVAASSSVAERRTCPSGSALRSPAMNVSAPVCKAAQTIIRQAARLVLRAHRSE
jgi:hypothetical protein